MGKDMPRTVMMDQRGYVDNNHGQGEGHDHGDQVDDGDKRSQT